jgi:hypothetical protein
MNQKTKEIYAVENKQCLKQRNRANDSIPIAKDIGIENAFA